MATDDLDRTTNYNELHHMRRDARDAHSNSQLAKWLSIMALITAAITLAVAVAALNKAGDAQSTANRATERINTVQTQ